MKTQTIELDDRETMMMLAHPAARATLLLLEIEMLCPHLISSRDVNVVL